MPNLNDIDYRFIQECIREHCSSERLMLREQIKQHNNAVKRAFYLAISCEDTESLGVMLDNNIGVLKSTADKYHFYSDLVVCAIHKGYKSYKSFEYLIQRNPSNLNNHYDYNRLVQLLKMLQQHVV